MRTWKQDGLGLGLGYLQSYLWIFTLVLGQGWPHHWALFLCSQIISLCGFVDSSHIWKGFLSYSEDGIIVIPWLLKHNCLSLWLFADTIFEAAVGCVCLCIKFETRISFPRWLPFSLSVKKRSPFPNYLKYYVNHLLKLCMFGSLYLAFSLFSSSLWESMHQGQSKPHMSSHFWDIWIGGT